MRDKCLNCSNYPYVTDENRDKICYRCDFQDAVCELKRAFEESWMYKLMVKLLDWLEETCRNYPIHIHSMNSVGVQNMRRIIKRNGWTEVI